MDDLISRQAAIDAVVAWTVEDRPDVEMPTDLIDRIKALPSAHCDYCPYPDDYDGRVQVVRCKDCKHYENDVMGNPWGVCCHSDWITDNCGSLVDQNGWCYRAERRTDEL